VGRWRNASGTLPDEDPPKELLKPESVLSGYKGMLLASPRADGLTRKSATERTSLATRRHSSLCRAVVRFRTASATRHSRRAQCSLTPGSLMASVAGPISVLRVVSLCPCHKLLSNWPCKSPGAGAVALIFATSSPGTHGLYKGPSCVTTSLRRCFVETGGVAQLVEQGTFNP
jgi:hypothetical protein